MIPGRERHTFIASFFHCLCSGVPVVFPVFITTELILLLPCNLVNMQAPAYYVVTCNPADAQSQLLIFAYFFFRAGGFTYFNPDARFLT